MKVKVNNFGSNIVVFYFYNLWLW